MMIEFFRYLNSLQPLSPEATSGIMKVIRTKVLRRGQVWLQEGAVCDKMTFVVKGLMKLSFETGSKEVVLQFAREDEWMISAQSYFEGRPSAYSIRSIEQTVVVYLLRTEWDHLLAKCPELNKHYLWIAGGQIKKMEEHLSLLLHPPRDRFEKLIDTGMWLVKSGRLTDRHLSGYMGIGANGLGRWRKGL